MKSCGCSYHHHHHLYQKTAISLIITVNTVPECEQQKSNQLINQTEKEFHSVASIYFILFFIFLVFFETVHGD